MLKPYLGLVLVLVVYGAFLWKLRGMLQVLRNKDTE